MPRKPAFSAASLYVHFQPTMARAFSVPDAIPGAMQDCLARLGPPSEVSVAERLTGLKRLTDEDARPLARAH